MAEAVMLVCDECGKPDATSITIRAGDRNYAKDLCGVHLRALLKDTRIPRRGRRRKVATQPPTGTVRKRTASAAKRGRPKRGAAARNRATTKRRSTRKTST
jgi:hypothetical protein